jgi:hydrogenase expression/formation protein HypE
LLEITRLRQKNITLGHGSGGRLSREIYETLILKHFANPVLNELDDSALVPLQGGGRGLAFTTDSYVVKPLFFPGGDIGKLAVCGTINDLLVCGARPLFLSCGIIVEEGLPLDTLETILRGMARECRRAGVSIVTGDFKVVERGAVDRMFINTAGIGRVERRLRVEKIRPGDRVLYLGQVGAHGAAIVMARGNLKLGGALRSDCAALGRYLRPLFPVPGLRFMRDPTRGGLASVLCEIAEGSGCAITLEEEDLPLSKQVRAVCELTGLDPLYLANEGAAVIVAAPGDVAAIRDRLRSVRPARRLAEIGRIEEAEKARGRVHLKTVSGGRRILEMMAGEQLPRIC